MTNIVTVSAEAVTVQADPVTVGKEIAVSIPGVETFHPRSVWLEPCFPMSGKAQAPFASDLWQPIAHYSAAANTPDGDIGEFDYQIIPWLRAVQRDYWLNRTNASPTVVCGRSLPGYAIGYLFAIDWLGGVWELRGFDYMPAANAPNNHYTCPLLFITDGASPGTDLAWASARAVWREFRRRSGNPQFANRPKGHGEIAATACCGAGLFGQLHAGLGDLDYDDTPPEDDVKLIPDVRRLIDTRPLPNQVAPGQVVEVKTGHGDTMLFVNVVAAETAGPGFVTLWGGGPQPPTSNVNYDGAGQIRSSLATVQSDGFGVIRFTTGSNAADVVIDLQSYVG